LVAVISGWQGAASAVSAQAAKTYDPKPFLAAMIQYRRTALTCASVLGQEPVADSQSIDDYLIALGQTPPSSELPKLSNTVSTLIRAQAASICQDKLRVARVRYTGAAKDYQENKPEVWPDAPQVSDGPWCKTVACSELR